MNRATLSLIFATAILLPASSVSAAITLYGGNLTASQEVPPNASPGTGSALITVDDILMTMRVQVTFADLIGTTTASHIHCCGPAGTNVPVATELPLFTGFPVGAHSGTYDHTFDMTLAASYNPAFVSAQGGISNAFAALANGMATSNAYLNVHSSQFPGGEIRAVLAAVPEPSTWAMMLLGFGAIGLAVRSKPRPAAYIV
jgi:CHRD domain/PEP-CTERM motif